MAWKLLPAPPVVTQEELAFPLGLNSNADLCTQDPNGTYPVILVHEPHSLSALHSSLRARGIAPSDRKSPLPFGSRQAYPTGHHKKGSFLFCLALHIFNFSTGIIVIVSIGPQFYACIKQGKLKILVTTMALYKVPGADAFNGTLPLSTPIIPNEGHAKYVCLDPWVNALVTLAPLGKIVAFLMVRCRKHTLCRGLEYVTYMFLSVEMIGISL